LPLAGPTRCLSLDDCLWGYRYPSTTDRKVSCVTDSHLLYKLVSTHVITVACFPWMIVCIQKLQLDRVLHPVCSLERPRSSFLAFSHPAHCCLRHAGDPDEQASVEKFNTFQLNSVFFRGGLGPISLGSPTEHPAPVTESALSFANVIIWMLQR
jgi:hypothetical protein